MSTLILVVLLLLAGMLLLAARRLRRKGRSYAIPPGEEIYDDLGAGGRILRSETYGLSGKPDMIKRKGNVLVPYEYKTTDAHVPRDGHIFQMVAYFLILEDLYPRMEVPYGILKYRNEAFRIDNIAENRQKLLRIVQRMHQEMDEPRRNHSSSGRCFKCSYNEICGQKLITSKS